MTTRRVRFQSPSFASSAPSKPVVKSHLAPAPAKSALVLRASRSQTARAISESASEDDAQESDIDDLAFVDQWEFEPISELECARYRRCLRAPVSDAKSNNLQV